MSEEKKTESLTPEDKQWLSDLLSTPPSQEEIGADEQAVANAGLTHPDDLELEKIVQETLAEDWEETKTPAAPAPAAAPVEEPTQKFTPPQTQDVMVNKPAKGKGLGDFFRQEAVKDEKGRPKMKKGYGLFGLPHLVSSLIWVGIAILIGLTLGRAVWLCASDLLAFYQTPPQALTLVVRENDTVEDVAQQLKDKGLIRYPELFVAFADLTGKGEKIDPGTYVLNAPESDGTIPSHVYDYSALLSAMRDTGAAQSTVTVMFPEGYNCAQIFELLEKNGVCSVKDLEEYAANGELYDYWFLEGVERGHKYCLEGFLAPDTYEFYTNDDPDRVLDKFLDEFDDRFTERMHGQFEALQVRYTKALMNRGYGEDFINANMLTLRDVVTLASIVEKESANDAESFDVAAVFFNRLTNPGNYPYLGSDATILYATDYYNKGQLTTDALINASPYNTYTQPGLPAGPITNPGANSLYAALEPNDTGYYFFVYDKEAGVHRFSKTLSEHNDWCNRLGLS